MVSPAPRSDAAPGGTVRSGSTRARATHIDAVAMRHRRRGRVSRTPTLPQGVRAEPANPTREATSDTAAALAAAGTERSRPGPRQAHQPYVSAPHSGAGRIGRSSLITSEAQTHQEESEFRRLRSCHTRSAGRWRRQAARPRSPSWRCQSGFRKDHDGIHRTVAAGLLPTMGYGVPSGLGVQAATGRRPLSGGGWGIPMTGMELLFAAVTAGTPSCWFNNSSWEMLRAFQPESAFNDLDKLDYAALADTLGGRGRSAGTKKELHAALEQAFEDESCFQLVDISLERGLMSNTLSRFVSGFKEMRKK